MLLAELPEGAEFTVTSVLLEREVGKRLADMGFTEGAEGRVVRRGFLRGPMQVLIRGYSILIRRCEAAGVAVESAAEPLPRGFGPGRGYGRGRMRGRGLGHGGSGSCGSADCGPGSCGSGHGGPGHRGSGNAGPAHGGSGRGMRRSDAEARR